METDRPSGDPVLVEKLRAEIAENGPITFARFMAVALGDPERGYYAVSDARPTRSGDYLSAPELHPVFGAIIARVLDEAWRALERPDRFLVREYGAGNGRLVLDTLAGLRAIDSGLLERLRYEAVEIVERRAAMLEERLEAAGFGHVVQARGAGERPVVGCVLANEFLDALPVHRLGRSGGLLREVYVGWTDDDGGRFVDSPGGPSTPALAERLAAEGIELGEGQQAEVCLEIDSWAADMSAAVERGFAVLVDYGRRAEVLYGPARRAGTLRAYRDHRVHDDLYAALGRQDLTAHVDFTAVERATARHGWRTLGLTSQAEFLVGAGLGQLLLGRQADPAMSIGEYTSLRASIGRLLDPLALGGFQVLVLGRGLPDGTTLAGLEFEGPR